MTATAHINRGCIRFDQFQLAIEGRSFLALGTSTFTLHNSFAAFNAQVVGLADVRVKFTRSPTGSSLPPPSSFEELESTEQLPPSIHPQDAGAILVRKRLTNRTVYGDR